MKFVDNEHHTDPRINLAIEEYLLKHLDVENESYLLFYINEPCVIAGKNQNMVEEIHVDKVQQKGIHTVRRLSGGGAVYQDLGNLNFSFITKDDGDSFLNFRRFTQPVIEALHQMGVEAELTGRNDIQVGEKKISGNAQFTTKGRMFSHGTLMFDVNLDDVADALHVKAEKFTSKSTKSVRSRVTNIRPLLNQDMTIEEFKQTLLDYIFRGEKEVSRYTLTEADWKVINQISKERYQNWEWNFGKSPKFNVHHAKRFPIGTIDVRLDVEKNMIKECKIFGDFFGMGDVTDVESVLRGVRYDKDAITEAVHDLDIQHYFGKITKEEFVQLVY
ncbi:lipoate--protein ligase [Mechercharimyces sp. CAU 1602]|uniref:lipoate--protein ligase n=1 Tax=Mechercharimyces sp. CAU 1602 TaxID=2973933 RepID=UPI0021627108|nr:lipoate--protein ligase [Mechercharimyces sp. CAU 1602]MCS1350689.1 lipoate--protein ligase [Mechercharimyces sp. CAU 1602]